VMDACGGLDFALNPPYACCLTNSAASPTSYPGHTDRRNAKAAAVEPPIATPITNS